MIQYEIYKYEEVVPKSSKPRFRHDSREHREHVFARTLEFVKGEDDLSIGTPVRLGKRGKREGQIIGYIEDFKEVEWVGSKCCFIEVYVYQEGHVELFHPSEIHSRRNYKR